ncbi:MAG: flavodoxin domain-containing protein, partial [Lysobacter sp.]
MSPPALLATPLPADRLDSLARLTDGLDSNSLWWLSGYAAGLARSGSGALAPAIAAALPEAKSSERLSIVYGSQTGNAKRLAEQLAGQAEAAGLSVRLVRADAYPTRWPC